MCGRYGFTSEIADVKTRFDIERWLDKIYDKEELYNIGPGTRNPVVVRRSPNSGLLMKWGWTWDVPWMEKPLFIINARKDKLTTSKAYKKPFLFQRCIIPANFFYEWKAIGKEKYPYLFKCKDQKLFGFAGLYFTEKDAEGKEAEYYVIITTDANEIMQPIHHRMPVILDKEDEDTWLNPDNVEQEQLLPLLKQYSSDKMECYPVSQAVNSTRNDNGDLIKPIDSK